MMDMPGHEERCRQLAELLTDEAEYGDDGVIKSMTLPAPDPRFVSLRGEHEWLLSLSAFEPGRNEVFCRWCLGWATQHWDDASKEWVVDEPCSYCLRTDGDALDETIAACGYEYRCAKRTADWKVRLYQPALYGSDEVESGIGATSREAKSAALWQAVRRGERDGDA